MALRETTTFDVSNITNVTLQYASGDIDAIPCFGSINGTTDMRTITRTCKGVESSISKPQKLKITTTMFMPIETYRDVFGLTSEGLKTGIYAYGAESQGKALTLVARFKDDFQDKEKIIAIPKATTTSGLSFTADADGNDVVKVTLELEAGLDELDNLYYEAVIGIGPGELAEAEAKKWETGFKTTLVKTDE